MIVAAFATAMASGVAIPMHAYLFGLVTEDFVNFDLGRVLTANITKVAESSDRSCGEVVANLVTNKTRLFTGDMDLLCPLDQNSNIFSNVVDFICDPSGMLSSEISEISLYYVAIACGVLVTSFISSMLWNISAYRQTQRMRCAFYKSILHQEIGWFDVTDAAELNNRLQE